MSHVNIIEQYYDAGAEKEWQRLDRHRTELAVTLLAFEEFLPPPPGWIADIGGGPGRYSIELSRRGYQLVLADIAQKELDFALLKAGEVGVKLEGVLQANALNLNHFPSHPYIAVLLMGPLYHLLRLPERIQAIQQALGLLREGGLLFATFISRYAIFRDAALKYPNYLVNTSREAEQIFTTGVYEQATGFTQAYFAQPDEVIPLMESQGLKTLALLGQEGIISENEEGINALEGDAWQAWVRWNYRFAHDPLLRGAADHLLYVGRKLPCP